MEKINRKYKEDVLLQKREGNLEYLAFPLLENIEQVTHLFSTRLGGVSKGDCATLNLSFTRGDNEDDVLENYRRIASIFGKTERDFVCSDQTHTTNILKVTKADFGKGVVKEKDYRDMDGLVTNEAGIILSTFYADCVPLYFIDKKKLVIGLAHSGWKGTLHQIGKKMIDKMISEYGTNVKDLVVGIGPSICQSCYEISNDVAVLFEKEFESHKDEILYQKSEEKYHLDLWRTNEIIFENAGLKRGQIQTTDICTCCNKNYLFSHRASNGKRGNLAAFMMLRDDF